MSLDEKDNQLIDACKSKAIQKSHMTSTPKGNENTLTVNVQTERAQEQCIKFEKATVELSPQPLKIEIQNSTDWPTILVGCAGIISSIVIARYTSKIQSNQIKSNIANLRQRWIEDLRECASKFMEQMTLILNNAKDNKDYNKNSESNNHWSSMLSSQIKFAIMLDTKHEKNRRAITISEKIIAELKKCIAGEDSEEISILGRDFEAMVREILEEAWQDIKHDLLSQSWYNRVLRSIKKSLAS